MGYNLKRTEADISGALKKVLDLMEKAGQIIHHDRLNSGLMFVKGAKGKSYPIHLCRPGTPDRFVILKTGTVLWLEIKSKTGKQAEAQKDFEKKLEAVSGHHYMIVTSVTQVVDFIEK